MAKSPFKTLFILIQKRTLSATASPPIQSFTVKYLVDSWGLSPKTALSISEKIQLKEESIHKTESVLKLLKSHGFDDTHIAKFITKFPRFLLSKADNNLKPKLEFLAQNGLVGQLLPELLAKNPYILCRKLSSHIKPSFEFLWGVLQTQERVVSTVKIAQTWPYKCNLKNVMQPNIDLLKKEGVPDAKIADFIAYRSGSMMRKADWIASVVKDVKEMGIHPSARTFLYAIHVKSSMSDSVWNKKVQIFKNWGLSEEGIVSIFKRYPFLFACSEENLRNTMDFFVNTAKLTPEAVIAYPVVLTLSVDRRIRPRYNVYVVLIKEKLLNEKMKLGSLLLYNEEDFLKKYVTKHLAVVPSLLEIYNTAKKGTVRLRE